MSTPHRRMMHVSYGDDSPGITIGTHDSMTARSTCENHPRTGAEGMATAEPPCHVLVCMIPPGAMRNPPEAYRAFSQDKNTWRVWHT